MISWCLFSLANIISREVAKFLRRSTIKLEVVSVPFECDAEIDRTTVGTHFR